MVYECPACQGKALYPGAVFGKGANSEVDSRPFLRIEPARFRFTIIEENIFDLRQGWLVCRDCGTVWTHFDPEALAQAIYRWLKDDVVSNTMMVICRVCAEDAVRWNLEATGRAPYRFWFAFEKVRFKLTLTERLEFDVSQDVIVCSHCATVTARANKLDVGKKVDLFEPRAI